MKFNFRFNYLIIFLSISVLAIVLFKYINKSLVDKNNKYSKEQVVIADVRGGNHGYGLGNQFFTFAISYAYSKNFEVKNLIINNFNKCSGTSKDFISPNLRCYALDKFGVKNQVMYNFDELSNLAYQSAFKVNKLKQLKFRYKNEIVIIPLVFGKNIYNYFRKYKDEIKEQLQYQEQLSLGAKSILKHIEGTNSVSIHVRRGDYKIFNWCYDLSYQIKAAYFILNKISNPKFFVFTDDIDYVKQYFKNKENFKISLNVNSELELNQIYTQLNNDVVYVSEKIQSSLEEFHLMSKCKNNIITNSTFSWWAAFLNKNSAKLVIAPSGWGMSRAIKDKHWIII